MNETLTHGYSYESTQLELSNEYQHDMVWMIFKNRCILVLLMKVASALEWLSKTGLSGLDTQWFTQWLNGFRGNTFRSWPMVVDPLKKTVEGLAHAVFEGKWSFITGIIT